MKKKELTEFTTEELKSKIKILKVTLIIMCTLVFLYLIFLFTNLRQELGKLIILLGQ